MSGVERKSSADKADDATFIERSVPVRLENAGEKNTVEWAQLIQDAIAAERQEREQGWRQAFKDYPQSIFWSFAISLCIIMEGYDTALLGSITGLPIFRQKYGKYSGNAADGYQLEPAWQTAIGQASTVGNIIGIFVASWFQDRYGYRHTIQISLVLMAAFVFIVFFAPNVQVLFVGELLCGLPWGAFSSSAVSYASEVTPVALRGYLTTYVNLCWVIGQFISAGVLLGVQNRPDKWSYKIPFAVQWASQNKHHNVWPIPLFILATLAPESPWLLVRAGKLEQAKKSVMRLSKRNGDTDPDKVIAMMVRTNQLELENQPGVSYFDCFRGSDLRRTEIACIGWAIQVLSGSSHAYTGTYFFEQAGLSTANAFKFNLGQYAIGFCGTVGSWFTMTYVGRRTVYLYGLSVLAVLLILIGGLAVPSAHGDSGAKWGQAALVLMWVFTYDFTVGPVAYCIVGEVSSTRLRVKTVGLARITYNIVGIVAGILNTYMMNPLAWGWKGYAGFFWFVSCVLCWIWSYFRLPECKGRTYRELDILFERHVSARRFRRTEVDLQDSQLHEHGP
ncbi:alpha-glucoside:hydrogen symporter [Kockovaella imperatae]|uniref:Alpha-glucoside:hydrogen symporter n=1 Tax=Kockovaella imperatae TaxID=4999 RepID=A0A1Y1UGQ9_9TREE|nr:alpha-glucoside:hydrogen symporter [Kockovaella imperatae]ORX36696.1 alpha-glucoside:hydrogen symporter [Kockovaella imperatae]